MSNSVLDAPISRQWLIDDMNMRCFAQEMQRNYLRDIGHLATFRGRSPGTATTDDLGRLQIEQQQDGVPVPTVNSIVSALRFFFTPTVDRPDLAHRLQSVVICMLEELLEMSDRVYIALFGSSITVRCGPCKEQPRDELNPADPSRHEVGSACRSGSGVLDFVAKNLAVASPNRRSDLFEDDICVVKGYRLPALPPPQ